MKNSPIIKVKNSEGTINLNANHVVYFIPAGANAVEVGMSDGSDFSVECTERSFRSYMNKALGVTKEEKASEE